MARITRVQQNLLAAIEAGDEARVRKILSYGIDLDFISSTNKSPLHSAIRKHEHEITALLIDHGADINMPDNHGKTPLDIAIEEGDAHAITIIRIAGGKAGEKPEEEDEDEWDFWREPVTSGNPEKTTPPAGKTSSGKNSDNPFTPDNLKDIFNAEKWVGKTEEMEKLWKEVPKRLKKDFDFAAALAAARRETAKTRLKSKKAPLLPKKPRND